MQYMLTPYSEPVESYCWWGNEFTEQELTWLQQKAIGASQQGQVGSLGNNTLSDIRRSKVSWIDNTQETEWVFKKLSHIVSSINSQFYRFDLTGFGEPLQLTNYDSSEHGMYGWHQDSGGLRSISRKMSLVLQLSDPSEYEGGNLQIMTDKVTNVKKQRGLVAVFPSYTVHQVTPVTQGSRQTLVAWVSGPAFK